MSDRLPAAAAAADRAPAAGPTRPHRRPWRPKLHALVRWLHIYSSLLGLMTVLFFGITGLTLNHPDWFGAGFESVRDASGTMNAAWLGPGGTEPHQLEIVEFIRSTCNVTAAVRDFQADEFQINVSFAGPAYTADVRIDRETSSYEFTEVRLGLVAVINDLHKGRDTGPMWSVVIDVSAILLVFLSVSGALLLIWLKRRWRTGLLTLLGGLVLFAITVWLVVV